MESCSDMCLTIRDDVTLSYQNGLLTLDMGNSGSGRTRRSVLLEQLTDLRIFSDTTSLEIFVIMDWRSLPQGCTVTVLVCG